MNLEQAFYLAKEPDFPDANEDVFAIDAQGHAAALSDGASESFDSQTWGRLLCEAFLQEAITLRPDTPEPFIRAVLAKARAAFAHRMAARTLSWSQQAALSRGNFASLVGVRESSDQVALVAIGDSLVMWQDTRGRLQSWVLQNSEEFRRSPVLLGSDPRTDAVLFGSERRRWGACQIPKANVLDGRIWLMTDAIGAYVTRLNEQSLVPNAIELLQSDIDSLSDWSRQKRFHHELRIDDTTLLSIRL